MEELETINYYSMDEKVPNNVQTNDIFTNPVNMPYFKKRGPIFFKGEMVFLKIEERIVTVKEVKWKDVTKETPKFGGWWYYWADPRGSLLGVHEIHLRKISTHNDIGHWLKQ